VDEEPFAVLCQMVADAFPDWPIYGGLHDSYVPHLTVGHNQPFRVLQAVEAAIVDDLPIAQPVTAVDLWQGPALASRSGQWQRIRSFSLGTDAK